MTKKVTRDSPLLSLFTIGYGGWERDKWVKAVLKTEARLLVNVKRFPGRAYSQQFSGRILERTFARLGVRYLELPDLGPSEDILEHYTAHGSVREDFPVFLGDYMEYLDTSEDAREALVTLIIQLTLHETVIMVCAEHEHTSCHRSGLGRRVAELEPGVRVIHVDSKGWHVAVGGV